MYEQFRRRHAANNDSSAKALRNQADVVMNGTFTRDPNYRKVLIDGQEIDAKFAVHTYRSITSDSDVDYYLMFRPGITYKPGVYVDIPNRNDEYERWLIVANDDQPQFPLHYVLKCNWTLKWVSEGKIYSCLGVQRSRSNYNGGTWRSDNATTVENQTQVWLPTTNDVNTIRYGTRFLISHNPAYPIAWEATKLEDTLPEGLTKITLSQSMFDPSRDNTELMIADYYTTNIDLIPADQPMPLEHGGYSKITFKGTAPVIKVNGSYKTLIPNFYDNYGNVIEDEIPVWDIVYPSEEDAKKFDVVNDGNNLQIKCLNFYDMLGKVITITLNNATGTAPSHFDLEVVGL